MSYNEMVAQVEAIQAKLAAVSGFDNTMLENFMLVHQAHTLAEDTLRAVKRQREAEAAMCAEWELRQDAMADALSANWGHD